MTAAQMCDIDIFFNYGSVDLDIENQHDLMTGLLQDKRSMFYNRSDGAGVSIWENQPNGLLLQIGLRFDIAQWINRRNTIVGDGTNGTKNRQIAVSQFSIDIQSSGGNTDVSVQYIELKDYNKLKNINITLGGTSA